jgi:hypothetical protein
MSTQTLTYPPGQVVPHQPGCPVCLYFDELPSETRYSDWTKLTRPALEGQYEQRKRTINELCSSRVVPPSRQTSPLNYVSSIQSKIENKELELTRLLGEMNKNETNRQEAESKFNEIKAALQLLETKHESLVKDQKVYDQTRKGLERDLKLLREEKKAKEANPEPATRTKINTDYCSFLYRLLAAEKAFLSTAPNPSEAFSKRKESSGTNPKSRSHAPVTSGPKIFTSAAGPTTQGSRPFQGSV